MQQPFFKRSSVQLAACAATAAALVACGGSGDDLPPSRSAGLVYGTPTVAAAATGGSTVSVAVLTRDGMKTISTAPVSTEVATALQAQLAPGDLVDWIPGATADQAAAAPDPAQTFNVLMSKGSATAAQFDMSRYGVEVSRHEGAPGPMVAAGWVYGKTPGTITVGDGGLVKADMAGRAYDTPIKRYEETFQVARDVKVFAVDTSDYAKSAASDYASIPVTANYDYSTTSRQAAYLLFDRNHERADKAKVVAIWYFTPQSTSDGKPVWDVPTLSPLLADKGNDPVSGQPYVAINATGVTAAPYTRSTEPFEMVKDTLYFVGDNEVSSYILKADMGTPNDKSDDKIIKIDAGWANSGYQYWKNMELLGIDPRSVTDLWLTHGHGDHYGTVVEQLRMMDNVGKKLTLWGSKEDTTGIQSDLQGNSWNIAPALPASETEIRARTTEFYKFDQWYEFGNVRIMVIFSPGHTPGSTNMLFQVKNPVDGKFVTFGYHGGYGFNGMERPTATNGWRRLAWQHGFSYLQQKLEVDFVAPQHANHFPIVEVYQALKAYNRDPANANKQLTMLDALRSKVFDSPVVAGQSITSEFANQLEKRRSVVSYKATDNAARTRMSLETSGPFKPGRENGLVNVRATVLDDARIVQGFVGAQNKNPLIPLLADGMPTTLDPYTNDPNGYYVQVSIDVQDPLYKGYLPEGYTQFSPGMGTSITYQGGPIESTHAERGTYHPPEVLRTVRLASLQDAQKVLARIVKGGTYTISLTPASEIVVPADPAQTFQ
ncbi:MBL fold metallo-hydrolase [Pseudorhodoferax sp. Leaf267]|uniref:MBL fold metallo-hydrolase n=1 Tax=Pseudorhodoferax sp. Leaf267 TaxID=1736316 RepID=UPI0006F2D1F4|nr:MBL fold metallo-hydrolase [Pseudorhodoferax sp. Leaf267]KQP17770.1 hypothetical protein ASF43_07800 [Pseudorhodoferax sp. Leaf267]